MQVEHCLLIVSTVAQLTHPLEDGYYPEGHFTQVPDYKENVAEHNVHIELEEHWLQPCKTVEH